MAAPSQSDFHQNICDVTWFEMLLVNDRLTSKDQIDSHLSPVFRCYLKVLCQLTSQGVGGTKCLQYLREPRAS